MLVITVNTCFDICLPCSPLDAAPEGAWWGGIAFSAMNVGFFTVGAHALATRSPEAMRGVMLGTGVMFLAFAGAWFSDGYKTRHPNPRRQGTKIALLGTLFLSGYLSSLLFSTI